MRSIATRGDKSASVDLVLGTTSVGSLGSNCPMLSAFFLRIVRLKELVVFMK